MSEINTIDLLKAHLNVNWLRPESALWDAIASTIISKYEIIPPSLDLGCGNGIFGFITAGGNFSIDYDWYINVTTEGFWDNKDIYDVCKINSLEEYIIEQPRYKFTFGLDYKPNLLNQAKALNFYEELIEYDANLRFPFEEGRFKTIFSNILYWLEDSKRSLEEIYRILCEGGIALLCIPNTKFFDYCITYQWKERGRIASSKIFTKLKSLPHLKIFMKKSGKIDLLKDNNRIFLGGIDGGSELLRLLNRGRSESMHWTISYNDFLKLVKEVGFKIVEHSYYLSPLTLKIWDIGLRPLSPLLIKMANGLTMENRRAIKIEWIETATKFLLPLYEMENKSKDEGGFHLFVLNKT